MVQPLQLQVYWFAGSVQDSTTASCCFSAMPVLEGTQNWHAILPHLALTKLYMKTQNSHSLLPSCTTVQISGWGQASNGFLAGRQPLCFVLPARSAFGSGRAVQSYLEAPAAAVDMVKEQLVQDAAEGH